jgi:hypothetical protein
LDRCLVKSAPLWNTESRARVEGSQGRSPSTGKTSRSEHGQNGEFEVGARARSSIRFGPGLQVLFILGFFDWIRVAVEFVKSYCSGSRVGFRIRFCVVSWRSRRARSSSWLGECSVTPERCGVAGSARMLASLGRHIIRFARVVCLAANVPFHLSFFSCFASLVLFMPAFFRFSFGFFVIFLTSL